MSSPKQMLVSCLTLICLERREDSPASPAIELINTVADSLELKENAVDHDSGRQTFLELKQLVQELNNRPENDFPSLTEVLQRAQVACREEAFLYEAIHTVVTEPFPDGMAVMHRINSYRKTLNAHLNEESIKGILKEYSAKVLFARGSATNITNLVREMNDKLDPLVTARQKDKHPAEMGSMSFDDIEGVMELFDSVQTTLSTDGAFRTGWKDLNDMLGKVGAFRRGEFVLTSALQHNFKSYLLLLLFVHFCLFNKPYLKDSKKKPLLLFVTLENEIPDNLLTIYKYIKENETGEEVIIKDINREEAAAYVCSRLEETGFSVKMVRFDPTEFTSSAFTGYLDGLMAEGWEIQALLVDYLNMMSKSGIDAKVAGDDIRLLFRKVRNFTSSRSILFITPHQLSSDALQLQRENTEDFVKVIANRGYYDGCRRLGQEPDLEIHHHLVKYQGKTYLAMQRGKHRNTVTSEELQYLLLPLSPVGTIPWDIDKEESIGLRVMPGSVIGGEMDMDAWSI